MTAVPTFLLFGADGQVGYELARELAPLGTVVPRTRQDADLEDGGALRAAVAAARPTVVVNAAAYTAVDAAESDAGRCRLVNAVAPGVLAAAAEEVGAAVVHFSTDYVFDGASDRPYTEDDAPSPLNVYGATKLDGERAVAEACDAYLTFRLGWVYGLRGRNFLRTMLRLARERDELTVVSDQFGAPTWSRLVAAAVAQVVARGMGDPGAEPARQLRAFVARRRGVYHLGSAGTASWHAFAEAGLALDPARSEQRCTVVRAVASDAYPTAAQRPRRSLLDSRRAAERFGVRLPDWRDQLALALRA